MSLNQLLYKDTNVDVNNRPWLDIVVNSMRFGAKGDGFDQQVLDYYTYDPDTPNNLTLAVSAGVVSSGSMTIDVARVGRFVTIQLASTTIAITANCTMTASAISSNSRPRSTTYFALRCQFNPTAGAYGPSVGIVFGDIATNGVITFSSCMLEGGTDGASGNFISGIPSLLAGTLTLDNTSITYLHAA